MILLVVTHVLAAYHIPHTTLTTLTTLYTLYTPRTHLVLHRLAVRNGVVPSPRHAHVGAEGALRLDE